MTTDPGPASTAGEPAATEPAPAAPAAAPTSRSSRRRNILLLLAAVIAFDVAAAILVPPFPKDGGPGVPISGIGDLIQANLEFPAAARRLPGGEGRRQAPLISFDVSITNSLLTMWIVMGLLLRRVHPRRPDDQGGSRSAPERRRVHLGVPRELGGLPRRTGRAAPHPAVRGVLRVHPVLELERPAAVLRPHRGPARPDERRQRHDRPRARRLLLLPLPGLPPARRPRLPREVLRPLGVQAGRRQRASSTCSSASSSSCSSSSSRSRWRCDSSATSSAARWRSASSRR